jgi:hypothetical protein
MLPIFCLRLAAGMMACLMLLSPRASQGDRPGVNPRFFKTHFLTALALGCLALLFLRETAGWRVLACVGLGTVLAFAGSLLWSLDGAPGGRECIVLTCLGFGLGLVFQEISLAGGKGATLSLLGSLTSAAVLGSALTAMLMGHSYLIAPAMSLQPLYRLLAALAGSIVLRMVVEGFALWFWTGRLSPGSLEGDAYWWLPLRWGLGFVAPLALTWMAWQTARIRSTQSATGILYVVVIFCFLGEGTSLLLRSSSATLG